MGKGITPPTFILRTPRFLLRNRNAMSAPQWEVLKEQQLRAYYKPVETWKEPPPVSGMAGTDPREFTPSGAAPQPRLAGRLPKPPKYAF